jgi:hypothetical protein
MSWIAVGVAGVAALSYMSQSQQAGAQADQDQATANANASQSIANMQAVEAQASAQETAQRDQSQQYLGRQRAAMADSGTGSLSSGSNFDVARQSATNAEIDALNVRYSGELRGSDYLQSAYNYRAGAAAAGAQSAQIAATRYSGAATAALTSYAGSYGRGIKGTTNLSGTPGTGTNTYNFTTGSL